MSIGGLPVLQDVFMERVTVEAIEYSIHTLLDHIERDHIEIHNLILSRGDKIIFCGEWKPYDIHTPYIIHSLTKIFTNTAIGFAMYEGKIRMSDTVVDFFPEYFQTDYDRRYERMTVESLIRMQNGHGRMISGNEWRPLQSSWLEAFFREPMAYEPLTHYQYSSGNSYILSAILQRAIGMRTEEYLRTRFFEPLGIDDYTWDVSPEGINPGGNGLSLSTLSLHKAGLFYLQRGSWNGQQLLPKAWIDTAMGRIPFSLGENSGYAYHWESRGGCFLAGGAFGQTLAVIPDKNMALTATAACEGEDLWNHIVHDLGLEDQNVRFHLFREDLQKRAKRLSMERVPTQGIPLEAGQEGSYDMEENAYGIRSIEVEQEEDGVVFKMRDQRGLHSVRCGTGEWRYSMTSMTGNYLHHQYQPKRIKVAAFAWWKDKQLLYLKWRYPGMAFCDTVKIHFSADGGRIWMDRSVNINSQARSLDTVTGRKRPMKGTKDI